MKLTWLLCCFKTWHSNDVGALSQDTLLCWQKKVKFVENQGKYSHGFFRMVSYFSQETVRQKKYVSLTTKKKCVEIVETGKSHGSIVAEN